jgi:hypothetical protein
MMKLDPNKGNLADGLMMMKKSTDNLVGGN